MATYNDGWYWDPRIKAFRRGCGCLPEPDGSHRPHVRIKW